jgi:hypothetical protein
VMGRARQGAEPRASQLCAVPIRGEGAADGHPGRHDREYPAGRRALERWAAP